MKKREHLHRHQEHHPKVSIGLFLILLGLALLVATNDLLKLGSVSSYFTWQTAMIFVGALLILNLQFTGGVLLIAGGIWFFLEKMDYQLPEIYTTIYWPSVIILIGIGFIISSFLKKFRKSNQSVNQ
ncbi:MAG: hypothetical protein K0B05_12590 [Bacteroidales bacterium]|nr:hypothetical protein [Bacteroidales bacterium]